jgi:hypothetical protein
VLCSGSLQVCWAVLVLVLCKPGDVDVCGYHIIVACFRRASCTGDLDKLHLATAGLRSAGVAAAAIDAASAAAAMGTALRSTGLATTAGNALAARVTAAPSVAEDAVDLEHAGACATVVVVVAVHDTTAGAEAGVGVVSLGRCCTEGQRVAGSRWVDDINAVVRSKAAQEVHICL